MEIKEFLSPDDVLLAVRATDKTRLLKELSERAALAVHLDGAYVTREILKREQLGSTGVGNGIAIPHARLAELDKPFGLIAQMKRPVEFDAIDGAPVDLIFLLLQPAQAQSDLNALAAIARKLRENDRLKLLRDANDPAALYREITR